MISEPRWLSAAQQDAWRNYLAGVTALSDQLDKDLREHHNLSLPEYEMLVRLSEQPEHAMRMADLAESVSYSRSRVTHTVARLEKVGFVQRQSCAEDRRGIEAVMTAEGFENLKAAAKTHVRGVREYFVDLASDEDFARIGEVMSRVRSHLKGVSF